MANRFADFFLGPQGQRKQRLQDILLAGLAPTSQMGPTGIPELEALRGFASGTIGAIESARQRPTRELQDLQMELLRRELAVPEEVRPFVGGKEKITPLEFEVRGPLIKTILALEAEKTKRKAAELRQIQLERSLKEAESEPLSVLRGRIADIEKTLPVVNFLNPESAISYEEERTRLRNVLLRRTTGSGLSKGKKKLLTPEEQKGKKKLLTPEEQIGFEAIP